MIETTTSLVLVGIVRFWLILVGFGFGLDGFGWFWFVLVGFGWFWLVWFGLGMVQARDIENLHF